MNNKDNRDVLNELLDCFIDWFREVCDEPGYTYEYDPKEKYDKETYTYNFDKNKIESTKQDLKDNPDKIVVLKKDYEGLIKLVDEKQSEINKLKSKNEALVEAGKKVSENGHKIVDSNSKLQHLINDKLYADGYKIMNDIKIYIEFARKCDALKNGGFVDMMNLIAKTVSDFITSQKEPVFC